MRRFRRFLEAIAGGIVAAVPGAAGGAFVGGIVVVTYYVVRIALSIEPFVGARAQDILSALTDTGGLALRALLWGAALGGGFAFFEVFTRIMNRRPPSNQNFFP